MVSSRWVDDATATLVIYGSAAVLMTIATWIGWKRASGRTAELSAPRRGNVAVAVLIAIFAVLIPTIVASVWWR
jgi:hypothetical protein